MDLLEKATTLKEVSRTVALSTLRHDDSRFVDLTDGRASVEMQQLRLQLRDASTADNRFAKIGVTGHRGAGKSTELRKLEHDVSDQFLPLYFTVSNYVLRDCDTTDIMIWLVESLVRRYSKEKWPIDANIVIRVANWFARKSFDNVEQVKDEIRSESGTDFQAQLGFYWLPILLLNRIKSMLMATSTHRDRIRQKLHTYTSEMLFFVNELLDEASRTLGEIGKNPELLLIIDNLDHMPSETARHMFFDSADIFKELRVNLIFTFPITLRLPPYHICHSFQHCFTIPLVRTHSENDKDFKPGINVLVKSVENRTNLKKTFGSKEVVRFLAQMSGGNIRDLMLLTDYAQLAARAKNKKRIDMESAGLAVKRLRLYYEKLLIPHEIYYPMLFGILSTKREHFLADSNATSAGAVDSRFFGCELIGTGAVIDHDEDNSRYELHPVVPGIRSFEEFCAKENDITALQAP